MAVTLFGVTFTEAHSVQPEVPQTELVVVRDLAAICGESEYASSEPTDEQLDAFTAVISAYCNRGPVLPAPIGVVFRARESVQRWIELHYVSLSDALGFVDDRIVARVHVWRPGVPEEREVGSDLAAVAAESMRTLRRSAVSTLPLRAEKLTGIVLSAAFLVEKELWKEFVGQVEEQGRGAPNLRFEVTGPWPPYDFVQMQLGT